MGTNSLNSYAHKIGLPEAIQDLFRSDESVRIVDARAEATRLKAAFPDCGLTVHQIADQIARESTLHPRCGVLL